MRSLRDVLRILRRYSIDPDEILISDDILQNVVQQIKQILSEDEQAEDLASDFA